MHFSFRFVSPAEYVRARAQPHLNAQENMFERKKRKKKRIGNARPSDSFVFAVISNKLSPHMKESCAVCTHQTTLISFSPVVIVIVALSCCISTFCFSTSFVFSGSFSSVFGLIARTDLNWIMCLFFIFSSLPFGYCIRMRDNRDATDWLSLCMRVENLGPASWTRSKKKNARHRRSAKLCRKKTKKKAENCVPAMKPEQRAHSSD